jgi:hypothetical protein
MTFSAPTAFAPTVRVDIDRRDLANVEHGIEIATRAEANETENSLVIQSDEAPALGRIELGDQPSPVIGSLGDG